MPVILASAVRQVRYSERAGNCQPHISALAGVICFRCCTGKIHDFSKSQILAFSFHFQMIQNWQDTPGVCVSVFTLWAEPVDAMCVAGNDYSCEKDKQSFDG